MQRNESDFTAVPVTWVRKGRGAVSNISHRFESVAREPDADTAEAERLNGEGFPFDDDALPALATVTTLETAKSLITYNESPDIGFDRSINPYRGCEHGCIYCFARPTHSYLNLSPGLDFETKLVAKHNAVELLQQELAATGYK
ncbi:MAG TPA: radical SAM protein, partial [Burkholderiaceae bacterium]|nr:radical SAM protein [Burkholderiaceae bacterium]